MKFSVIIPASNEEELIGRCIQSIQSQGLPAFEIIVVDNGSNDQTAEIAKQEGARVIFEPRQGISYARNSGASAATGDILCFIDADGVMEKDWLQEAERSLSRQDVLAVTGINIFTHQNPWKLFLYNTYTAGVYLGAILSNFLLRKFYIAGNNSAIHKLIFEELGGFEPVGAEDIWLSRKFQKLSCRKGIVNTKMVIHYSSRGFDSTGYIPTLRNWVKSSRSRTLAQGYNYKNK